MSALAGSIVPSAASALSDFVPVGRILSPLSGADVRHCQIVTGSARVPSDMTLVLAYRYLNETSEWYFQPVRNFDDPAQLGDWGGTQFFGDHNQGKTFELRLLAIDRAEAIDQVAAASLAKHDWHEAGLPAGAVTLDSVALRGIGDGMTDACRDYDDAVATGCRQHVDLSVDQNPATPSRVTFAVRPSCGVPNAEVLELILEIEAVPCKGNGKRFYDKGPIVGSSTQTLTTKVSRRAYVIQVRQDALAAIEVPSTPSCASDSGIANGWYGEGAEAFFSDPATIVSDVRTVVV